MKCRMMLHFIRVFTVCKSTRLTIVGWVICDVFISADFSKLTFSKNTYRNIIIVLNIFFRPDLGTDCLQMLSADDTSRHRISAQTLTIKSQVHSQSTSNFKLIQRRGFIKIWILCVDDNECGS